MRTSLKLLLALCAAAAVAAAQAASVGQGVGVVAFGWKYEGYVPVEVVRSKKSGNTLSVKRGTDYVFKYRATATVKNSGAKAVKAVEWDYVFVEPEGGKELKRYRLQSKQAIGPGATETLSKDVSIKPEENTRHLTAGRQQVVVTRVEYADGSVWKAKD
ncbi:MAG: hypothetical protein M3416_16690 [Acidobacteriota bacterium]|nr:hypothetical protein [Acidobacteriota bacterium]